MHGLPVREMILFKHGVGFFRREGITDQNTLTLTFRQDAINDVLKSLAVFDRGEGEVLGIHYQTPFDQAALSDSSIRLSDQASLRDLIRDLRGRRVELLAEGRAAPGRLVGLDAGQGEDPLAQTLALLIRAEDGVIEPFPLKGLRGLRILDDRAAHDLHFFLDSSMSEDLRREVTVRLSEGQHNLAVYYVAPSPTWRVSYRLVAESEGDRQSGRALIQGWGLFDNRLDEDLEDVQVTLVAGQPISFVYDLFTSRIPDRPVVKDEARTAPGPVEFRGEAKRARRMELGAMLADDSYTAGAPVLAEAAPAPAISIEDLRDSAITAAAGRDAGEFFQYVVTRPVSVRRGESALVPILAAEIGYQRELIYNGAKLPTHPVVALRFDNATNLTLERGPVTVIEDGEYKGEAVVPFTKTDAEVYLAFAVELGIRVTEHPKSYRQMAGLNLREGYLLINEYHVSETRYIVENTTGQDQVVTLEAPILSDYHLFDTPEPDVETAAERRWRAPVSAHDTARFTRLERRMTHRREEVRNLNLRQLERYLADKWLDHTTFRQLAGLLDILAYIEKSRADIKTLKDERQEIYARQAQARENLNVLKGEGEEARLRTRMLSQLETSENRLDSVDQRIAELEQSIRDAEQQFQEGLKALGAS